MKKILLAIIAISVFVPSAFAAVSSPCSGYTKPKEPAKPRVVVDTGYRRDVIDNRVPVETKKEGTINLLKAAKDRETLISGQQ